MDNLLNMRILNSTCLTCKHRESWNIGIEKRYVQYCGAIKSKRTNNGKLKIRAKNPACELYQERRSK